MKRLIETVFTKNFKTLKLKTKSQRKKKKIKSEYQANSPAKDMMP